MVQIFGSGFDSRENLQLKKTLKITLSAFAVCLIALTLLLVKGDLPLDQLEEKYAGPPSQFIEVEGMNVHFRDQGSGYPLVLLHGTAASLHTWEGWVTALSDTFRIIRPDLPAFGLTGPHPEHDYRISAYVAFLHAFLEKLNVDKFALAGNSLGGFIAWRYALRYPQQVEKLILVDASGYPEYDKPPPLVFRLAQTPLLNKALTKISLRSLVEKSLKDVYVDDSKVSAELVDRYYELSLRPGNRDAFVARANTGMSDHFEQIDQLPMPVLLMWGEQDAWVPVAHLERFAEKLGELAVVKRYPDLGHVPMEEAPAQTAADTRAFLLR